jgi:hypothetical protein
MSARKLTSSPGRFARPGSRPNGRFARHLPGGPTAKGTRQALNKLGGLMHVHTGHPPRRPPTATAATGTADLATLAGAAGLALKKRDGIAATLHHDGAGSSPGQATP